MTYAQPGQEGSVEISYTLKGTSKNRAFLMA